MTRTAPADTVGYGAEEEAMRRYLEVGTNRALALDNRGPIRYSDDGRVHPDILESYWHHGFYVFTGVFGREELDDIERDFKDVMARLPVHKDADVDAQGRPALGTGCTSKVLYWSKPLGDPFGGTAYGKGRHPVKMFEPAAAKDAPDDIVYLIIGSLQFSRAALRAYGHPDLLAVSAAVNGDDFVPYTDVFFIKAPGLGASVAWHQDGVTHWDAPDWHQGSHGFNWMGQLYGCTAANGVWVVPGSHKQGKVDIKAMVAEAGTERLPQAVPMVCDPGDAIISNRQLLHGSFANTSKDWRVTLNMGCLPRAAVLDVAGGGIVTGTQVYDAAHIEERSKAIGLAIAARQHRFPDEAPYQYKPFIDAGKSFVWNDSMLSELHDYSRLDMSV